MSYIIRILHIIESEARSQNYICTKEGNDTSMKDISMALTRAPFPGENTGKSARAASNGQPVVPKTGGAGLHAQLTAPSDAVKAKLEASSKPGSGTTDASQANMIKEHEKDTSFLLK